MAKIQFSDVVPPEKRSIRDIPIPNSGKRKVPIVIRPQTEAIQPKVQDLPEVDKKGPYEYYYPQRSKEQIQSTSFNTPNTPNNLHSKSTPPTFKKNKSKKFVFGSMVVVAILIFVISMMTVFASAGVLIKPKSQDVEVSMDIVASSDASEETLKYEVVKLSKQKTSAVEATGEEMVENKAKGKIVIYNNFSSEPQRLIIRTRFETPEGLIYRIPESVNVPGKSIKNGVETPGSIEVEVFADEAGEKYNIGKSDFTVPGFKNDTARYKGFYARSVGSMTGGFVGKMKTVLPEEKQKTFAKIDVDMKSELTKELQSKVPEGLTLLTNSIVYESFELPQSEDSGTVILGKEGTAYAVLFNSKEISNKIISTYLSSYPDWANIKSAIKDFSALSVDGMPAKMESGQKIDLKLSGKVKILADIDTNVISQKLAGAPKKSAAKLMDEFPGISSVVATIRPMWKQSFPENPLKIKVQTSPVK